MGFIIGFGAFAGLMILAVLTAQMKEKKNQGAIATAQRLWNWKENPVWFVQERKTYNGIDGVALVVVLHLDNKERQPIEIFFPMNHPDYSVIQAFRKGDLVKFYGSDRIIRLPENGISTYLRVV